MAFPVRFLSLAIRYLATHPLEAYGVGNWAWAIVQDGN
jgi:hypothetical protein